MALAGNAKTQVLVIAYLPANLFVTSLVIKPKETFAPTLHHIPNGAQASFAALFSEMLVRASATRRVQDLAALMMMPRYILGPLERGGRKHQGKAAKVVQDRILSWRSGTTQVEPARQDVRRALETT